MSEENVELVGSIVEAHERGLRKRLLLHMTPRSSGTQEARGWPSGRTSNPSITVTRRSEFLAYMVRSLGDSRVRI
jgi:hypothetical protein